MKIFTTLEVLVVWLNNGKMAKNKTTLDKITYIFMEDDLPDSKIDEIVGLLTVNLIGE